MTQPTAAVAKLADRNDNLQIGNRQSSITAAVVAHTIADTTETVDRSDIEAKLNVLGTRINDIITVLEAHGLVADN